MELNAANLAVPKEKTYFTVVLILAILMWGALTVTVVGLLMALGLALLIWFANGLFVANLKADCVLINKEQLPQLFETYEEVCRKLELRETPELYVAQAGGFLNAFTTRHAGRNFVVLFSDIVESYGQQSDEIRFLLGHEIGHIKRNHVLKQLFLAPGLFFPLVGPAYSRACEATCDRYGAYAANQVDGAIRAMMILSGGKNIGREMSPEVFSRQYRGHRGFFVSWHELISGYPTLSQRVANLFAAKENQPLPQSGRHPLAYLFASLSFGGPSSGGGNMFVGMAMVVLMAAIVIPNLLRAPISTNDAAAQSNLRAMAQASESYASDHAGAYPQAMTDLIGAEPAYLGEDHCGKTLGGFNYTCLFPANNYEFTATPTSEGTTGSQTWTISAEDFAGGGE